MIDKLGSHRYVGLQIASVAAVAVLALLVLSYKLLKHRCAKRVPASAISNVDEKPSLVNAQGNYSKLADIEA